MAVGDTQKQPFELSFNSSLKVDFQGSRVTSDGGLVLVRELDQRLDFGELIVRHLADSRGFRRSVIRVSAGRGRGTTAPAAASASARSW